MISLRYLMICYLLRIRSTLIVAHVMGATFKCLVKRLNVENRLYDKSSKSAETKTE